MTDHPQSLTSRVSVWAQVLLSLVVAGFMDGALGASHSRPNILYIFADDMSYRAVGSYPGAHDWVQTPNLDRIAHEGVRFDTCYTGAWCQPARATALTGKLQHGVQWLSKDPPAERMADSYWPVAFRKAGYHTGIIGKWHTGNDKGHGHAWDYSAIWDHTNGKVYGGYYVDQKIDFNGAPPETVGGYSTDNYTDWAVEYVKRRALRPGQPRMIPRWSTPTPLLPSVKTGFCFPTTGPKGRERRPGWTRSSPAFPLLGSTPESHVSRDPFRISLNVGFLVRNRSFDLVEIGPLSVGSGADYHTAWQSLCSRRTRSRMDHCPIRS